ncbi:MAG: hypothetical protein ACTHNP_03525 [Solirubrobacterales bacterium]
MVVVGLVVAAKAPFEPRVGVAAGGTATVVWSRFNGTDSVVQARQVGPQPTPRSGQSARPTAFL